MFYRIMQSQQANTSSKLLVKAFNWQPERFGEYVQNNQLTHQEDANLASLLLTVNAISATPSPFIKYFVEKFEYLPVGMAPNAFTLLKICKSVK